jgi:Protein of unknown function (DUF2783)
MSQTAALDNQFEDADGFYEALLDAHAGLRAEESAALNARLVLLLANQVGHAGVLAQCIALAKLPSNR